jgi:hypothetical protein
MQTSYGVMIEDGNRYCSSLCDLRSFSRHW